MSESELEVLIKTSQTKFEESTKMMQEFLEALNSQNKSFRSLYLDLLRDTLSFSFWPEPLKPLSRMRNVWWQTLALWLDKQLRKAGYAIGKLQRPQIGYWPVLAHTMVGPKRLDNIRELCETIEIEGIAGSFVECGVWRGGASIFARACLPKERKVICCDSFCGMPYNADEPAYQAFDQLKVSTKEVQENFEKFKLWYNVDFVKGYFESSLKQVQGPIAILRADGDMYSSTMSILMQLYPKLVKGGYVIIDDYRLPKCRQAVERFRDLCDVSTQMIEIDTQAVYWRKE